MNGFTEYDVLLRTTLMTIILGKIIDNMVELFEIAREISNDLKHCKFETNTRTQTGFSSGFSDEFAGPIMVKTPQGQEISMDKLLRVLVEFWKRREQLGDFPLAKV